MASNHSRFSTVVYGIVLAKQEKSAAKALGISERLLWGWTNRGEVPHIRIGKAILYPVDLLRRWLDERAATAKEVPNEAH
jgi:hypothetical protein